MSSDRQTFRLCYMESVKKIEISQAQLSTEEYIQDLKFRE